MTLIRARVAVTHRINLQCTRCEDGHARLVHDQRHLVLEPFHRESETVLRFTGQTLEVRRLADVHVQFGGHGVQFGQFWKGKDGIELVVRTVQHAFASKDTH